jgi:dienelactone hydrolase
MSKERQNKVTAVLVHGAWADGSSWNKVTIELQRRGFNVVAAQIPLTSFTDDVAALRRMLRRQAGPVVLVGHSYGGAVITAAGTMSRFEVSSRDSCAQASWFCKGVVWKTNLSYLLKKKEMIMPGIMSEGSAAVAGPRYGAR